MTHEITRRSLLGGVAATGAGVGLGALPSGASAASRRRASTLIHGARVFVGDRRHPVADAVAIGGDGRILGVGSARSLRRFWSHRTELIDAHGGTIMSGIHDGHAHPMYAGLRGLNPSLDDAELSAAEVQALVTTFLQDAGYGGEPDSWLVVEAWNPAGTPTDTLPHKAILDALPTSRPVALSGSDGHNLWVNSRALAMAGIDAGTPDPTGGEIVRDAGGEPTGVLKDEAQGLVRALIPDPTPDQMYAAFAGAFAQMAAGGVTSILDAWVDPWQLDFYEVAGRQRRPAAARGAGAPDHHRASLLAEVGARRGARVGAALSRRTPAPVRHRQGLHGRRDRVPRPDRGPAGALPGR